MRKDCVCCRKPFEIYSLNHLGRCAPCQRRADDETERRRREDDDSCRRSMNAAMGDMLNTGIPGGVDMDITTPL